MICIIVCKVYCYVPVTFISDHKSLIDIDSDSHYGRPPWSRSAYKSPKIYHTDPDSGGKNLPKSFFLKFTTIINFKFYSFIFDEIPVPGTVHPDLTLFT